MERIAQQNEQRTLIGPTIASLDRLVARRDLGVEDLPKLRTKQVEMMGVGCS